MDRRPVTATSDTVASTLVLEPVEIIRCGKERVPDQTDIDWRCTQRFGGYIDQLVWSCL